MIHFLSFGRNISLDVFTALYIVITFMAFGQMIVGFGFVAVCSLIIVQPSMDFTPFKLAAMKYMTTNEFTCAPMNFRYWHDTSIKCQRDDFNDMFDAECRKRDKDGDISIVFVLTYNDEHITHKYGQNMLNANDLQRFSKSSRFAKMLLRKYGYQFDYVCVGEYGNGGESHNFAGSRGRGQNPHYHCVGWFHKVADVVGVEHCQIWHGTSCVAAGLEQVLPLLLRKEWQGCIEENPHVYGRDKFLRSLGLGYVKLDGAIRSKRGGTYISKYIGKDVGKVFLHAYTNCFCPSVFCHLSNLLCERGLQSAELCHSFIKLWCDYHRMSENIPFEISRFIAYFDSLDFFKTADLPIFDRVELFNEMDDTFWSFFEDYFRDLNTIHSPKVRKFHGFGYSLLDTADLDKGTYTIHTKYGLVTRFLPASLARHCYYEYSVRIVCDGYHKDEKQVCYTLNELGRKHLRSRLAAQVSRDVTLYRNYINSKFLVPAIIFNRCLSSHWPSVKSFDESEFVQCLGNLDMALDYAVNCRQFLPYGRAIFERRSFVNVRSWLSANSPAIYKTLLLLEKQQLVFAGKKDLKDAEFNAAWFKCFDYNY